MRPDLVIHQRGRPSPESNALFVEVKIAYRTMRPNPRDLDKADVAIGRLEYRHAVVLALATRRGSAESFDPVWLIRCNHPEACCTQASDDMFAPMFPSSYTFSGKR